MIEPKCQFCDKPAQFTNVSWTGEVIYLCAKHAQTYRSGRVAKPIKEASVSEESKHKINPCNEAGVALERYGDDLKAGHTGAAQYWKGQADAYGSVCLAGMPSDHELLLHFGVEELASPGIVIDEAIAKATPCTCFTYKGTDRCWSKGIIGMLKREQQNIYCIAGKAYKAEPKLTERYARFAAAAERAHKEIGSMPKGGERLETWLGAMGRELAKEGIEV